MAATVDRHGAETWSCIITTSGTCHDSRQGKPVVGMSIFRTRYSDGDGDGFLARHESALLNGAEAICGSNFSSYAAPGLRQVTMVNLMSPFL